MTETTPAHSEDPAEGADTASTDASGRTPHPEQPAEGADEADAEAGLDPENRITGA
ncbi:hypothetical protein SAMN03159343_1547 [Klenkia marina]|uniref:Uncharacterized protein n=1 Tax=Klenkia marina TaxID=1960309 RepID=A0A1G4XVN6_9ACTN|nr:hypothetical protein [Klenkia marina]SCX45223.1 hypothetical protein SAMN03159343_1547 [Klenkia marina]